MQQNPQFNGCLESNEVCTIMNNTKNTVTTKKDLVQKWKITQRMAHREGRTERTVEIGTEDTIFDQYKIPHALLFNRKSKSTREQLHVSVSL